jgi:transposase
LIEQAFLAKEEGAAGIDFLTDLKNRRAFSETVSTKSSSRAVEATQKVESRPGAILVNLDLRRVVDLLPDRAAESFSEWLQQHPEISQSRATVV